MAFDLEHVSSIRTFLKELELRCAVSNFNNFEFSINPVDLPSLPSQELAEILKKISKSLLLHDYKTILQSNLKDLKLESSCFDQNDLPSGLQSTLGKVDDDLTSYLSNLITLFVGMSFLQEFLRLNSSGPKAGSIETYLLTDELLPEKLLSDHSTLKLLEKNGESPVRNVIQPKLLYLSLMFLESCKKNQCITSEWWQMRCLKTLQSILPERIASLHDEMLLFITSTQHSNWVSSQLGTDCRVQFYVECAQMHLFYHEVTQAREFVQMALDIVGLEVELSGAQGKRTQFQQRSLPQLFVKLKRSATDMQDFPVHNEDVFLKDLTLEDDTLLSRVAFVDDDENKVRNLLPSEQVALLGYCCLKRKSQASDELLQEEMTAFVNCLLLQPKVWSIYVKVLIMRCSLEKNSSRRIERGLKQLESIISSIRSEKPPFSVRSPFLHAVSFPMTWTLEKELADLLLSLGLTKSALEIYERLELWEDVVPCYQRLGRMSCAEKLLRQRLEEEETPLLWCMLGDVLDDPEMYLKADLLSGGTNARCQRSLGDYYYKRQEYTQSIKHFLRSVEINHLQPSVWFNLGYAANRTEDYDLAARAYRQVVSLDHDNFQGWNNLSHAYIRTRQKERAWRSLHEAVKCNFDEWKVWENLIVVATDVGAFEDAMRSWHRLIDLKGEYRDSEVLSILVSAINRDLPDVYNLPASRLKKKALELMGRLTSKVTNDPHMWEMYSLLVCPDNRPKVIKEPSAVDKQHPVVTDQLSEITERTQSIAVNSESSTVSIEDLKKAQIYMQKALRYAIQSKEWQNSCDSCLLLLKSTLRYAELSHIVIQNTEIDMIKHQQSSAKLSIQPIIARVENFMQDLPDSEQIKVKDGLDGLKNVLNNILEQ